MFLGGYLTSAAMAMAALRLGSYIMGGRSTLVYGVELYGGLLMFSAYILYDTQVGENIRLIKSIAIQITVTICRHRQMIVEKASAGDFDHVKHAMDLLVNVIAIFVRILVILLKRAEDEKRKEERRRKRN